MNIEQEKSPLQKISPNKENQGENLTVSGKPDEINLLEYIYVVIKHKSIIIFITILGLVAGYGVAILKGPTFVSEAVIAARESDAQSTVPNFSQFGAFGGIVANQLNLSGSPGLDKIEIILDSRKFSAELIGRYNLLPSLYARKWSKEYRKYYDTTTGSWNEEFVEPNQLMAGMALRNDFLSKDVNRNNTMTLKVQSNDSLFTTNVMDAYLEYLNIYIQTNVTAEARENVSYLEKQLVSLPDPLLREKLQSLIASEVEKAMLVSKEAFRIIDPQYCYTTHKEKKLYPAAFACGSLFISVMALILFQALAGGNKTEEDKRWIEGIRRELKRIV